MCDTKTAQVYLVQIKFKYLFLSNKYKYINKLKIYSIYLKFIVI